MKKIIFLSVLIPFVFLGCAKANVAVFHALPENPIATKYAFLPMKGQETSLEYSTYKDLIKSEFSRFQYEEVPLEEADVLVVFGYSIGGGREKVGSVPVYGQTGVSSSTTYGTVTMYGNYGTYSGYTTYTPTYGITGYRAQSYTHYPRELWLHIIEKPPSGEEKTEVKVLYEAFVKSEGSSSQLARVMPAMVKAMFIDFPGKSGSTRTEFLSMGGK